MNDHSGTLLFPFASSLLLGSCNLPIRNSLGLAQSYELELLSPPKKVKAISSQYDVGMVGLLVTQNTVF